MPAAFHVIYRHEYWVSLKADRPKIQACKCWALKRSRHCIWRPDDMQGTMTKDGGGVVNTALNQWCSSSLVKTDTKKVSQHPAMQSRCSCCNAGCLEIFLFLQSRCSSCCPTKSVVSLIAHILLLLFIGLFKKFWLWYCRKDTAGALHIVTVTNVSRMLIFHYTHNMYTL